MAEEKIIIRCHDCGVSWDLDRDPATCKDSVHFQSIDEGTGTEATWPRDSNGLKMPRRTYIAGPMTGYPDFNRAKFAEAAKYVQEVVGWEVATPVEMSEERGKDWSKPDTLQERYDHLRGDIAYLIHPRTTDIVMLDGWKASAGARVELEVARAVGLTINLFTMDWFRSVRPDSPELAVYPEALRGLA